MMAESDTQYTYATHTHLNKGKFYGMIHPKILSVPVHQIIKIYFLSLTIMIIKFYLSKASTK